MEIVAVDIGFNASKVASSTGKSSIFPSVIGTAITDRFTIAQAKDTDRMIIRLPNGHTWPVGETALDQSAYTSSRRDAAWVVAEPWEVLFCAALSEAFRGNTTINVVTGLPLEDWETWRNPLRKRLIGAHQFQRDERRTQTVTVSDAVVVTQAYGSLLDQALTDGGKIRQNVFSNGTIAVADFGGNTMNLMVCRQLKKVGQWTHGDGFGLLRALDAVARDIHTAYPTIQPRTHEVAQWLSAREFAIAGQKVKIAPFADPHLQPLIEMIVNRMTEVWPEPGRYDAVLLTGGGSLALGQALKARMENIYPNVQIAEDAQCSNVAGYLKFGRDMWE
jgi:hypothetical protein